MLFSFMDILFASMKILFAASPLGTMIGCVLRNSEIKLLFQPLHMMCNLHGLVEQFIACKIGLTCVIGVELIIFLPVILFVAF